MIFQASDYQGKNFLDLNNDDNLSTRLTYSKDSTWLKHIRYSNTLCICTTRAIINHAPISEYYLRFFSKEFFVYLYGEYLIKSRDYILNSYRQFRKYWNSKRNSLKDIIVFIEFNLGVLSFYKDITW